MFIKLDVISNFEKVTKLVKMWRPNRDITISAMKSPDQVPRCFAIDEYRFSSFSVFKHKLLQQKSNKKKTFTISWPTSYKFAISTVYYFTVNQSISHKYLIFHIFPQIFHCCMKMNEKMLTAIIIIILLLKFLSLIRQEMS